MTKEELIRGAMGTVPWEQMTPKWVFITVAYKKPDEGNVHCTL